MRLFALLLLTFSLLPGIIHGSETEVTVKKGDTLYSLAREHRTTVKRIAELNALTEPYAIKIGQKLKLPADAVSAQPASASGDAPKPADGIKTNPFRTVAVVPMPPPPPAPVATARPDAPAASVASNTPPSAASTPPADSNRATAAPTVRPATVQNPPSASPAAASGAAASPPAVSAAQNTTAAVSAPVPAAASTVPLPSAGNSGLQWQWPTDGTVIARFVPGDQTQQGINIAGRAGTPVKAAADGVVVYSGAGLVGYGELIIVKHSEEWLSAYAHNRARLVKEGQKVKAGETIAEMGRTGAVRDMLHFEIRRNGKPVDPEKHLPKR